MASSTKPLPEFEQPPVSEVALSVQFQPLENWRAPHAGVFWSTIQPQFPHVEVHNALPALHEKFGEEFWQQVPQFQFETINPNSIRTWFVESTRSWLIQVQPDRFVVNWRKVTGDEVYPRYVSAVRPRFVAEWQRFRKFITSLGLGEIEVQQCEVTYVNDIAQGQQWQRYSDALRLLSYWQEKGTDGFLPPPETFSMSGTFEMPERSGRLHFTAQRVIRRNDNTQALQVKLIARGRPASSQDNDVLAWMDQGREWIVRGFADLTSEKAQAYWKRKA